MSAAYMAGNALLFAASVLLVYRVDMRSDRRDRVLFAAEFGTWVFFLAIIVIFMALGAGPLLVGGAGGLLRREIVSWVMVALSVAALAFLAGSVRSFAGEVREFFGRIRRAAPRAVVVFSIAMLVLLVGTGVMKVVRYTPHVYDVNTYHLEPMAWWYQTGTMPVFVPFDATPQTASMNREFLGGTILNLWGFYFFDNIVITEIYPVFFTLALCAALYRFMRHVRIRPAWALFFTAAVVSTPAVLVHMDTCKNYTAYVYPWASLVFLMAENLAHIDRRRLLLGAAPFALAWSCKIVATFVLPVAAGAFLIAQAAHGLARVKRNAWVFASFAALCVILTSAGSWFWVYRNYSNDGSYFSRITEEKWAFAAGGIYSQGERALPAGKLEGLPFGRNLRILFANIAEYPYRVTDKAVRGDTYEVDGTDASNFGLIYFSIGQVFLVVFVFLAALGRRAGVVRRALIFVAAVAAVSLLAHWGVYFNRWSYRSHLFVPVMFLPVSLWALYVLCRRRPAAPAVVLLCAAMVFHWWGTLYDSARTTDAKRLATEHLPLLSRSVAGYWWQGDTTNGVFSFGDDVTIAAATYGVEGTFFWPLHDTRLERRLVWLPTETLEDGGRLREFVTANDIDVIYADDDSRMPGAPGLWTKIHGTRNFYWVPRHRGETAGEPVGGEGAHAGR